MLKHCMLRSFVLDTDRYPRRDFFHHWFRNEPQFLDQTDLIDRTDLKRVGASFLGQAVQPVGLQVHHPRIVGVGRFPFRDRDNDLQGQLADAVGTHHDGGPSFLDFLSNGRVKVHQPHVAPANH